MATTKEMLDDAELAKSYITSSNLSDDYKKLYLRLINISTMATNGISTDEKIQKMTECILLLAVTQGMYLSNIDNKIEASIAKANAKQCENCKAMKHANDIEREKHDKELLSSYMKRLGVSEEQLQEKKNDEPLTWMEILKNILTKPYVYVVLCLMFISPYSVDIVKVLCQYFTK